MSHWWPLACLSFAVYLPPRHHLCLTLDCFPLSHPALAKIFDVCHLASSSPKNHSHLFPNDATWCHPMGHRTVIKPIDSHHLPSSHVPPHSDLSHRIPCEGSYVPLNFLIACGMLTCGKHLYSSSMLSCDIGTLVKNPKHSQPLCKSLPSPVPALLLSEVPHILYSPNT